ncbi:MAG: ribosomal protein S18-alanine N-acetyltransferase [Actinobacteria bacterium]|nr:ribosomal protein S18-alanine N-acetyltransferase [Actinomycetota bacterium]
MNVLSETVIRGMSPSDLEDVLALERLVFPTPWTREIFEYEIRHKERALFLVAEVKGRIEGYMGAHMLGDEVHLTNMAVAPGFRRRGLGTAMFLECLNRGIESGARWVTLEVRDGNDGAREFYRNFGFRDMGLRKGYYSDTGEDAVIMASRDLQGAYFRELLSTVKAALDRKAG